MLAGVLSAPSYSQSIPTKLHTPVLESSLEGVHSINTDDFQSVQFKDENYIPREKAVQQSVDKINKSLESSKSELRFSVHEGTKDIVVKVVNKDSGEVIREFPSEKILDMVTKMWEMSGILVDQRI